MSWNYAINSSGGVPSLFYSVQQIVPFFAEACMIITFVICFVSLKNYDSVKAFAASSFIMTVAALFFVIMGILNNAWLYGGIIATAVSVVALYFAD